ncbi:ABC transporter permease [Paraburkholderia phenoliruptrix]|uniref:ABC transporter permease n=1 Tax=Paraburkholderia phenoliruptrix TaxID=252970 RepID=UPI002869DF25|nr:ABC transporter permease [Paraburkholderia phenoliruptrix]WMY10927.1 ABC transporter permease [Paraburkholderia phenoliruptrix]
MKIRAGLFAVQRLAALLPLLLGVCIFTFFLVRVLPGDPAVYYSTGPVQTQQEVESVRKALGLDQPLPVQLGNYLVDVSEANLGRSLTTGQPVTEDLLKRFPATLELTLSALILALLLAIPLGIIAAVRSGSWIDHAVRFIGTLGVSMPTFVTGVVLTLVFFFRLDWAPVPIDRMDTFIPAPARVTGFLLIDSLLQGNWEAFRSAFGHLILPALTMTAFVLAPVMRTTRASMLSVLSSDFIRTARAAGMSWRKVYITYALRNALLPVLTVIGLMMSYLIGANVVVEKVFAWPGVGSYALNALLASDYAPVQGYVLLMAVSFILINMTVDVLYAVVDPRVQGERE